MIGNTEYSLVNPEPEKDCCHNMDLLSATGESPYLPLPFDFDFAGLVDAPYAEPNPRYPVRSVRRRFYKGVCANNELLPETLQMFRESRSSFERIVDESGSLNAKTKASVQGYLESFYDRIANEDMIDKYMIRRCNVRENVYE